jgi:glycosyltransferase involved in cell wall biosynthesis
MEKKIKKRICFGMTLHNKAKYLSEAIESLLSQRFKKIGIVAIDDFSQDETESIMRTYAAKYENITYIRNSHWKGMISSWRKAFYTSLHQHNPDYFAWASDHDVWHPDWAKTLVEVLQSSRSIDLAYPETEAISSQGEPIDIFDDDPLETVGMKGLERLHHLCSARYSAGNMVYGLFRSSALQKAGVFRRVIMPDRLLISEIGLNGDIKIVRQKLWKRRYFEMNRGQEKTLNRQQEILFGPETVPLHSHTPFVSHVMSVLLNVSIAPENGDYSNFFKGLMMAGTIWERRKTRIMEELERVRFDLIAASRSVQGSSAESPVSASTHQEEVTHPANPLDWLIMGLSLYRDQVIQQYENEIRDRKLFTVKLKNEIQHLKAELEQKAALLAKLNGARNQ